MPVANPIENATAYISNKILLTNATGNFSAPVSVGQHVIWIYKQGYHLYANNVSVVAFTSSNLTARLYTHKWYGAW